MMYTPFLLSPTVQGGHSNCNVPAYLDPTPLRNMGKSVAQMAAAKAASGNTDMVLALEETGGSYQGGCDNITNRCVRRL